MRFNAYGIALALTTALGGCATTHYTVNAPISRIENDAGHRLRLARSEGNSDSMFIHISISGGGLRAAALAYGALDELANTRVIWAGRETTLWNEVDVISAVSGGSLLAGYIAVYGDSVFTDFVPKVLGGTLQSELLRDVLSPANLWRQTSPRYGRSDVLERLLDERVFKGARFSEIAARKRKPFVIVIASEMHTGDRFDFTQDRFDRLCSDLGSLPIARAVAASSAVPIVLSPITFWDYGNGCSERSADRSRTASNATPAPARYVHVVDGGLADNLAIRQLIEGNDSSGVTEVARAAGYRNVAQVVFVTISAETSAQFPEDASADVPNIIRSAFALADIPINHVSADGRNRFPAAVARWEEDARRLAANDPDATFTKDVSFHLIDVNLRDTADDSLKAVSTSLEIDEKTSNALRALGKKLTRESPGLQRLLRTLEK
jgi:NTE family protein